MQFVPVQTHGGKANPKRQMSMCAQYSLVRYEWFEGKEVEPYWVSYHYASGERLYPTDVHLNYNQAIKFAIKHKEQQFGHITQRYG